MDSDIRRARTLDIEGLPMRKKVCLLLEALELPGGIVQIPILVARGESKGPLLLAAAGIHGDEYEGMEAIRRVFRDLDPGKMAGTFVGIPVCNPLAYDAVSRVTPACIDGMNLARVFPGDPDGSPTEVLAHRLTQIAKECLDEDGLLVDLHSGGTRYRFLPVISYRDTEGGARDRSMEAARAFGLPRLWVDEARPGRFTTELCRMGIPAIGGEMTGSGECRDDDVSGYAAGLMNCLGWLGVQAPWPQVRVDSPAVRASPATASESGFLRPAKELGDVVAEQEVLADIVDMFGVARAQVRSPRSGYILAIRSTPAVRQAEAAAYIAYTDESGGVV